MSSPAYHIDACKITETLVDAECPFCTEYYKKNGHLRAKPRIVRHQWGVDPSHGIYGSVVERTIFRKDHCGAGRFPIHAYAGVIIHIYPNTRRVKSRRGRS
jgi:hypothetical protein